MENILNTASKLGGMIAASSQAAKLKETQSHFENDEKLTGLMKEYQQQAMKMQQLEQSGAAIEVADKHRLGELRNGLLAEEKFIKFNEAQMEYADLLRQVNQKIDEQIAPPAAN